jgi:hypothetical protein
LQGGTEQKKFQGKKLEAATNMSRMLDSTHMSGLDDIESNNNELSLSGDRDNIGIETQVSVDSASLRSPVDSMLGDDHRQLLGEHISAVPITVNSVSGGRHRNLSSKSSSSTRRYRLAYSNCLVKLRIRPQYPLDRRLGSSQRQAGRCGVEIYRFVMARARPSSPSPIPTLTEVLENCSRQICFLCCFNF